ncbi:RcnB family protein [Sphingomonas sp.]|uniref:RcnB family protein n=1 Tax=Sphingomonas sp. TaxID=28214 RepID=UPI0031DA7A40
MVHPSAPIAAAHGFRIVPPLIGAVALSAAAISLVGSAKAAHWHRPAAHATPPVIAMAYWDRRAPGWWRGHPWFVGYRGVRRGYFFVPGRGYVPVPPAYYGRPWRVGHVVPPALRRYHVHDVGFYRLRPAPRGHVWIYVDNNIVLMRVATGVIVDVLHRIW